MENSSNENLRIPHGKSEAIGHVKFFGKWSLVEPPNFASGNPNHLVVAKLNSTLQNLIACMLPLQSLKRSSQGSAEFSSIETLESSIKVLISNMGTHPISIPIRQYQLEILCDAVIPYLETILARKASLFSTSRPVDASRYRLLNELFQQLYLRNISDGGIDEHPSIILQAIEDTVLAEICKQKNFWKSDLQTKLEGAIEKQWKPILKDTKTIINNIAVNLIVLGALEIFGRQIIMLAFPTFVTTTLLRDLFTEYQKLENNNTCTNQLRSKELVEYLPLLIKLGKVLVLLVLTSKLLYIITLYNELGYVALGFGVFGLFVSTQDSLLKTVVIPRFHPYLMKLDMAISWLSNMEVEWMETRWDKAQNLKKNSNANGTCHNIQLNSAPGSNEAIHNISSSEEIRANMAPRQVEYNDLLLEDNSDGVIGNTDEEHIVTSDSITSKKAYDSHDALNLGIRKRR